MEIVKQYLAGLEKAYFENGAKETWEHFVKIKHGATKADLKNIKNVYPEVSSSLISLLEFVDGTYWREYKGEKIILYYTFLALMLKNIHIIYYPQEKL